MEFTLDEATAVLERTPVILAAWLAALPEAWLKADEGPDTFSPRDVLGHLIGGEETDWIPRARMILEKGTGRTFEPFDRFGFRRHAEQPVMTLLETFAGMRAANLETLRSWKLGTAELSRRGLHPDFGEVTLRQLLATWVVHDLGHLGQIARVMSKRYAGEVGPWHAYLPVLHPRTRT